MMRDEARRPPAFSIGVHLAVYGLALLLPLLLFAGFALRYVTLAEQARIEASSLAKAHETAADVDRELAAIIARLEVLAAAPELAQRDAVAYAALAASIGPGTTTADVLLMDLRSSTEATDWRAAALAPFRARLLSERLPVVSDLVVRSGEPSRVLVATPVQTPSPAGRTTVVTVGVDRLRALLRSPHALDAWRLAILDRNGRIVARSPEASRFEGRTVPAHLAELSLGPSTVVKTTGLEGIPVYRAHAHLTVVPWRIVVALPASVVEVPLQAAWRTFTLAGAALLGLSVVLAMMHGQALAGPIRAVARSARALGAGGEAPIARSMLAEINAVDEALHEAARQRRIADETALSAHERMRIALRAARMGTFEIDLRTGAVQASPERLAICDISPDRFDGRLETLDRQIHPDDLPSVLARRREVEASGGGYEQEYRIVTSDGANRWVLTRAELWPGPDGKPARVMGVTMDITARKLVEQDLVVAGDRAARQLRELEALYASAPIGLALFDRNLCYVRINEAMAATVGVPRGAHAGRTPADVLGPLGSRIEDSLEHVMTTGAALIGVALEGETPRELGAVRAFSAHCYPILEGSAGIAGVGLILEDVTDDRRAAERQKLLIRELRHRANNMLAVIQSVARRSLSGEVGLVAARTRFLERLQALARAHNMLTDSDWRGVLLEDLLRVEVESFADRIVIQGPRVTLDSGPAQTFALVIHELAVNAVKYGALSVEAGRVLVTWEVARTGPAARFRFCWQEQGGPPVRPPERRGFGTELLERAIVEDFDKPAVIGFAPDGLRFEIDVPFATIRA